MEFVEFAENIRLEFKKELPGEKAQMLMSPLSRATQKQAIKLIPNPTPSAIPILFYPINNIPHTILMVRNSYDGHHSGQVSFPGGKVEPNERHYDSLVRELKEELNITVTSASPLMQISHDYSDKSVTLDIWKVTKFDGYAEGVEGQETRWVPLSELRDYNFPSANQAILERLISDQSPLA